MKTLIHAAVSMVALAFSSGAYGQAAAAPAGKEGIGKAAAPSTSAAVQDIIITATRRETSLQNTPIAVTAISGASLQQRGSTSLLDVQNLTPGLTVSSRSGTGAVRGGFTIRGIGVDSLNSSSAVGLYVDEVYYPSVAGNLLGLFDVDRVEVLRGPQGTLFGRNTIAGAVQYITVKPDQQLGGFLTGSYGNLESYNVAGAVNVPVTDTIAVRASARYDRRGGFVYDELNRFDRGRETTKQGRLAVRWRPTADLTIDLKGEMLRLEANGRAIALLDFNKNLNPPGSPNAGAALVFAALGSGLNPQSLFAIKPSTQHYRFQGFDAPESDRFDFRAGEALINWDLGAITLKSITAYSFSRDNNPTDLDNTFVTVVQGQRGIMSDNLFTQELQASGKAINDRLSYTIGGYYFNDINKIRNQAVTFGPSPLVIPVNLGDPRLKNVAEAAYGQISFKLTPRLTATAGLRYSHEKITGSYLNSQIPGIGGTTALPAIFQPYRVKYNDSSPSFGLDLQANPDLLLYGKASKGFRAGGVAINGNLTNPPSPFPAVTTTPGYQPYRPETAWTYEGGARMSFLDKRLRINPTVFYTDWTDIQFNSFIFTGNPPTPNIITRNAGDAHIWGAELEWQAAVTRAFELHGSFSYLKGKYTKVDQGIDVNLGTPLQHLPRYKVSAGGSYTLPLATGKLTLSADYAYTSQQRSAVSNADYIIQPAYALLNMRAEYMFAGGRFSIAAYGTNLTNKYYYIGGVNGFSTFGSVEADLGRPREYGVTGTVRF